METFKSFFIGGYECADHINNRGNRVNLLADTAHDKRVEEDYLLLTGAGIKTVREGIRWSFVEKQPHQYDFSEVKNRILAAKKTGIQQLWDICHFGYPDNLMPSHPQFADRFANVCKTFTELYRSLTNDPLIVTPVNEISFLSWLGGDVRGTVPFAINSGFDVKYFLCRAAIRGIEAIRSIDPSAKIMLIEPLIKVHPSNEPEHNEAVIRHNEAQYEAMNIITGRMCAELGGKPEYMDLAGFNYYYDNQWVHCGPTLGWYKNDPHTCFSELLKDAWLRFQKPVVLAETGHFGEDRARWMEQITDDCITAMEKGVDLQGICIYPVLDRPDWDMPEKYIPCGIWGYNSAGERYPDEKYLASVQRSYAKINRYLAERNEDMMLLTRGLRNLAF
ncbi:MAG: amine oxidase [Chitinophagaceae bacterium]